RLRRSLSSVIYISAWLISATMIYETGVVNAHGHTAQGCASNENGAAMQLISQADTFTVPRMETAATHTIDGAPLEGVEFFDVINPATASVFARAPDASREQLDLAVAAA